MNTRKLYYLGLREMFTLKLVFSNLY